MRKVQWLIAGAAGVLAAVLVASCGGGGGSSGSSAGSPSTSSGVISAFGSIYVGGVKYATTGTTTVASGDTDVDPAPGTATPTVADLDVGMTVDLDSDGASAPTASLVRFRSLVRGEVDTAPDSSGTSMTVLGQTVTLTGTTAFAGNNGGIPSVAVTSANNILAGDYVTVYGYLNCTSNSTPCTAAQVTATLVVDGGAAGAATQLYRVEGYANNAAAGSFGINGLNVTYGSSTTCVPAATACSIANNQLVAVGARLAAPPSGTPLTLAAARINTAASQAPVLNVGATASIEGPTEQINTSATSFVVRGITINYSAVAGFTPTAGQIVEVTGTVASLNAINATAITAEQHASYSLTAPLDAGFTTASTTLSVLGVTFTVNSDTRFIDRAQNTRPFNSSNFASVLQSGNLLSVSGYTSGGSNIATHVVRLSGATTVAPGATVIAQGIVSADSASAGTLTIGPVTVTLTSGTTLTAPQATVASFFTALDSALSAAATTPPTGNPPVVAVIGTATTSTTPDGISASGALLLPSGPSAQWIGPQ